MIEKTLAKRYAGALLALADRQDVVEKVEAELLELKELYHRHSQLRLMLEHPRVPKMRKEALLVSLFTGKVQPLLLEFLRLLVEKGRIAFLPNIADSFDQLADVSKGVVRVKVQSFLPLKDPEQKLLYDRLSKLTGKKIAVDVHENRALKGGMSVRIGDTVMDGSVANRLKNLREQLLNKIQFAKT